MDGKPVLVTMSDLSQRRSDEFHALYRVRNGEIAAWTGESAERIHELLFRKAGLGVYEDELGNDPETDIPRDRREVVRKFFRESANDVLNDDMKLLFKLQSELCDELNEDIDPEHRLRISGEEVK